MISPVFIRDGGSEYYWVENLDSEEIIRFGKESEDTAESTTMTWPAPSDPTRKEQWVRSIFQWAVIGEKGEGGVLALADIRDGELPIEDEKTPQFPAIVHYESVDKPPKVLRRFEESERKALYAYTAFGEDFIVGTADGGFFLDIDDDRISVWQYDLETQKARNLGALPDEFSIVDIEISEQDEAKRLGPWLNYRMVRAFQAAKTISGLFWDQHHLYALAKSQRYKNRETDWWLLKLDTENGGVEDRFRLPLKGSRVKALPGSTWAFLEMGPAQFFRNSAMILARPTAQVFVPDEWFRQNGTLLPNELLVDCESPRAAEPR